LHVVERTEVDLAEQDVRGEIAGILLDLLLRGGDRLTDAPDLEIKIGQAILEVLRGGIGVERELVFFNGLSGVVGATIVDGHLFV
jgi:hypothetical protein